MGRSGPITAFRRSQHILAAASRGRLASIDQIAITQYIAPDQAAIPSNRAPSPRGAVARPCDNMGNADNCIWPVQPFVQHILANTMRCSGHRSEPTCGGWEMWGNPDMSNQDTSGRLAYIDSLGRKPDNLVSMTLVIEHNSNYNSVSLAKEHVRGASLVAPLPPTK